MQQKIQNKLSAQRGFTLIETLVAITLLMLAVIAPMALTVQSLASAYYARDEVTAYYLAQEGLEEVHFIRDGQILQIAESSNGSSINIFGPIPVAQNFIVDARNNGIAACSGGSCPLLQTNGVLYGYGCNPLPNPIGSAGCIASGWNNTYFTRTLYACYIETDSTPSNIDCGSTQSDEMRVTATISWQTGGFQRRTFTLSDVLYRWVDNGSVSNS